MQPPDSGSLLASVTHPQGPGLHPQMAEVGLMGPLRMFLRVQVQVPHQVSPSAQHWTGKYAGRGPPGGAQTQAPIQVP